MLIYKIFFGKIGKKKFFFFIFNFIDIFIKKKLFKFYLKKKKFIFKKVKILFKKIIKFYFKKINY